jgi:hemerythrin
MDLIIWRDSFETGYTRVDSQHKYLVHLINELNKGLGVKDKKKQMSYFFHELYLYIINHFSMEEVLMREFDYPAYMDHKYEHAQFIIKIQNFREKYLTGSANINVEVINFLKEWLLNHIMHTDKETFKAIQNKSYS